MMWVLLHSKLMRCPPWQPAARKLDSNLKLEGVTNRLDRDHTEQLVHAQSLVNVITIRRQIARQRGTSQY